MTKFFWCQDQILCHNFIQQLPKIFHDKIDQSTQKIPPNGKRFPIPDKDRDNQNEEIVTDSDKSHLCWRIKEGENFSQVFYEQKCPKTKKRQTDLHESFLSRDLRQICRYVIIR
jgi:hypothetical protein